MPTQSTTYNTRLTDEALEKRFRDTFRSQGGAELVDDLYASGVIVPVVDFTAAAEGSALRSDLQSATDYSAGAHEANNSNTTIINTAGFWHITYQYDAKINASSTRALSIYINDGAADKTIRRHVFQTGVAGEILAGEGEFTVFVRSQDIIGVFCTVDVYVNAQYRQIADVYGNLQQPNDYVAS